LSLPRGARPWTALLRLTSTHLDRRFAEEASHDLVAVMLFHEHVLATIRIGTLNSKDHGSIADCRLPIEDERPTLVDCRFSIGNY
jgi:hypothetical protein